jgi:transcriptional/translational regulatory protein YebC/TACO1
VSLGDSERQTVQKLVGEIDDLDDVDAVYTTLEVDGEALALDAEND